MTAGIPSGTSTAHLPGGDTTALAAALASEGLRLEELLAIGGSAAVYRAHDTKHRRAVAVKVLRPDRADAASAERFAREVAIVAQLRHPNILPLYDSGMTADGARYFVMPPASRRRSVVPSASGMTK